MTELEGPYWRRHAVRNVQLDGPYSRSWLARLCHWLFGHHVRTTGDGDA